MCPTITKWADLPLAITVLQVASAVPLLLHSACSTHSHPPSLCKVQQALGTPCQLQQSHS